MPAIISRTIEQNVSENFKEKYSNATLFYDITSIALNGYRSTGTHFAIFSPLVPPKTKPVYI
ncbi:MAG: hypothetical protein FIB07_04795 [Candidatus Methanoperedens sp.]|nr:hypothetical protein [Candidatus Methanoperedens sp.]